MATERMYDLAFQYKKTKLWKKLYDTDLFAIRLSDGETGYCCVMGMHGEVNILALYVGPEGFQSYRNILEGPALVTSEFAFQEFMLSADCLQCAFDNKSALLDDEIAEVSAYTKAHGITLRGAKAFPQFMKYQPNRLPWGITSPLDQQRICDALEACLKLSELLQKKTKRELGLTELTSDAKTLPLLLWEEGQGTIIPTEIPPKIPVEYPSPTASNDISVAKIKKLKKKGVLECEVIRMMVPIQEQEDEAPYYPMILLAADRDSGQVLPPKTVLSFEEHPEDLLAAFEEMLLAWQTRPRRIEANDPRTFALLRDLCEKTGIPLHLALGELSALEDAKDSLLAQFTDGEAWDDISEVMEDEVFDLIMGLSDTDLRQIPQPMVRDLLQLADEGILPPEVAARLRRVLT